MLGVIIKNDVNVSNLLEIFDKEVRKGVRNKKRVIDFENAKMQNVNNIVECLENGYIGHEKYNIFLVYEPKCRLVMSLSVKDKVINHFITRYILEPRLSKYLDNRNVATRKNMGTDGARKLVLKYINELKLNNDKIYVLKLDIKKYFYNIDHDILKNLLKDKLDFYEYELVSKIIDSTDEEYINNEISKICDKKEIDVPYYGRGKGLPIGNMTSQFLSIYYLYKLDHYIVHDLHLKYYVRYMDDFLIFDKDKKKLEDAMRIISKILDTEYKLEVNRKKTWVSDIKYGFSFLGLTYKVINKKTIIRIKKSNIDKIKKKTKRLRYLLDNEKISYKSVFSSLMTYKGFFKDADIRIINRIIDRNFYEK